MPLNNLVLASKVFVLAIPVIIMVVVFLVLGFLRYILYIKIV